MKKYLAKGFNLTFEQIVISMTSNIKFIYDIFFIRELQNKLRLNKTISYGERLLRKTMS